MPPRRPLPAPSALDAQRAYLGEQRVMSAAPQRWSAIGDGLADARQREFDGWVLADAWQPNLAGSRR